MATVKEHYDQVLSDVYSWMFGGFDSGIERNMAFFKQHTIVPSRCGKAVDLGAGCGFQSIPLSELGFSVTAIDTSTKLLNELKTSCRNNVANIVEDDLMDFDNYIKEPVELVICMTDTLVHLESKDSVVSLFTKVSKALEKEGTFIITFRDLSNDLLELDRFIPIKSDENTIFTCFLEYEPETVKVHDIVYKRRNNEWNLTKNFYRKLRLSKDWVEKQLNRVGFTQVKLSIDKGVVTVIASKIRENSKETVFPV